MYQPPDNFDLLESNSELDSEQGYKDINNFSNVSQKRVIQRKKQLQKLLIYLVCAGLGLGALISIGVVILLNKLGLTTRPYELETKPTQTEVLNLEKKEQILFNTIR